MNKKSKSSPQNLLPKTSEKLKDLSKSRPAAPEDALDSHWGFFPQVEPALTSLLRGLNEEKEEIRYHAFHALLLAFPSAEPLLADLVTPLSSEDPKVRLDAVRQGIILLANVMAAMAGIAPVVPGTLPLSVKEDLMEEAGRWIAWSHDQRKILAVADSFADAVAKAKAQGEHDPYVKKSPGVAEKPSRKPFVLLRDESPNILDDIKKVFPDSSEWLDMPNELLGGQTPRELIGTERERELRYLLRGIEDGITT